MPKRAKARLRGGGSTRTDDGKPKTKHKEVNYGTRK